MSHFTSTVSHAPCPNNQGPISLYWVERFVGSRQDGNHLFPHFWRWAREGAAHLVGGGHNRESLLGTGRSCKLACLSRTLQMEFGVLEGRVVFEYPVAPISSGDPRLHPVARSLGLLATPSQVKAGTRKCIRFAHWGIHGPGPRVWERRVGRARLPHLPFIFRY